MRRRPLPVWIYDTPSPQTLARAGSTTCTRPSLVATDRARVCASSGADCSATHAMAMNAKRRMFGSDSRRENVSKEFGYRRIFGLTEPEHRLFPYVGAAIVARDVHQLSSRGFVVSLREREREVFAKRSRLDLVIE